MAADYSNRFIPAFAGTTNSRCRETDMKSVHPRVRGDHGIPLHAGCFAYGSSPRSRGPRRGDGYHSALRRFIPAFAGTTHHSCPG